MSHLHEVPAAGRWRSRQGFITIAQPPGLMLYLMAMSLGFWIPCNNERAGGPRGVSPRVPIYQDTLKIGEKSKRAKSQSGRGFQRGGLKWPRVSRPEKRYARQEPPREVSGGQNGGCLEGPRQLGSPPIVAPGDGA